MKKVKKNTKTSIKLEELFDILNKEIESYDIRESGSLEKKMTLVKFKKELERHLDSTS